MGLPHFMNQSSFIASIPLFAAAPTLNATDDNGNSYSICIISSYTCTPAFVNANWCPNFLSGMNLTGFAGYASNASTTALAQCNSDLNYASSAATAFKGYSLCNTSGCNTVIKMATDVALVNAAASAAATAAQQLQQQQQATAAANAAAASAAAAKSSAAAKKAAAHGVAIAVAVGGVFHILL
jgi:hypothetical protein